MYSGVSPIVIHKTLSKQMFQFFSHRHMKNEHLTVKQKRLPKPIVESCVLYGS